MRLVMTMTAMLLTMPAVQAQAHCDYWPNYCQPYYHHHHCHWHCHWHGHHHHHCGGPFHVASYTPIHPISSVASERCRPAHECPPGCRAFYYGPYGNITIDPAVQNQPRTGHGSIWDGTGYLLFDLEEWLNGPNPAYLYFLEPKSKSYWRISKRGHCGYFEIARQPPGSSDYLPVMRAQLKCECRSALTAGLSHEDYDATREGGDSAFSKFVSTSKPAVRVNRRSAHSLLDAERKAAVARRDPRLAMFQEASLANRAVPKRRLEIRGKWYTPAETKIVASWHDRGPAKRMEIVQVLPSNSNVEYADTKPALVVSTRSAKRTE